MSCHHEWPKQKVNNLALKSSGIVELGVNFLDHLRQFLTEK